MHQNDVGSWPWSNNVVRSRPLDCKFATRYAMILLLLMSVMNIEIFIYARSRVAEYMIGFCLETAKNIKSSKYLELADFRHVHSFL